MIEKMKKLTLLLYHREQELFVGRLRELGVVHVEENPAVDSEQLSSFRERERRYGRTAGDLKKIAASAKTPVTASGAMDAATIADTYDSLKNQRDAAGQALASLAKEKDLLEPWGECDPQSIKRLEQAGLNLVLLQASEKKFAELSLGEVAYEVIATVSGKVCFAVVYRGAEPSIEAERVQLPPRSLSETVASIAQQKELLQSVDRSLVELSAYEPVIRRAAEFLQSDATCESVKLSFEAAAEGRVVSLIGWLPVKQEKIVADFLNGFAAWYSLTEPTAEENVPVKLHNGPVARLFEPITRIFALPNYFELDPTAFFAPFYALFFGLCLGDVGYGSALLLIGIFVAIKGPAKLKGIFMLVGLLGIMTILAGIALNSVFGQPLIKGAGPVGPALLNSGGQYYPAMPFAIYLGIFQILLGMGMKGFNRFRAQGLVSVGETAAHMVMTVGLIAWLSQAYNGDGFMDIGRFSLGIIRLGPWLNLIPASVAMGLMFAGLGLLLLFKSPKQLNPAKKLGGFLLGIYQYATAIMADGLSYIRLFALGLAGSLLANAFNQIGFMFITQPDGTIKLGVGLVGTIVVLLFGHALNLFLSALGAFVHSLRLTFVEFYNNLSFKGGARAFAPFTKPVETE